MYVKESEVYRIFLIGRISFKQKGHDRLINVLSKLDKNLVKNLEINFLGDGEDLIELKKMVKEKIPYIKVNFLGWLGEPWDVAYIANLIVIPSRFEGVPLVMLEALELNVKILASNIDGMVNYLDSEYLFNSDEEFLYKLKFFITKNNI